jgi:hypothetical protein
MRTVGRVRLMRARRPWRVLAALGCLACVAGIQVGVLSAPIALSPASSIAGSSKHIVGYRLEPRAVQVGQPVRLTLFFEKSSGKYVAPKVTLVRTRAWGRADPVAAPTIRPFLDIGIPGVTVKLIPKVAPGTYKLRLGGGRAFALLQVLP